MMNKQPPPPPTDSDPGIAYAAEASRLSSSRFIAHLYRVNIRAHNRFERESWLDVAGRSGHIEKLYAIASAELTYTED